MCKTKTTGAGKRVRELPVYIDAKAYINQEDWLVVGYHLIQRTWRDGSEYVFNEGVFEASQTGIGQLAYSEAAGASVDVLSALVDYDGEKMIPEGWERFWSEHSERSTLPSTLAALGVVKTDRDLLGRWMPEGSDQYVRTYNAAVSRLQKKFAEVVKRGDAYESFDEGSMMEELKDWLTNNWASERGIVGPAVEAWKKKVKVFSNVIFRMDAQSDAETEVVTPEDSPDAPLPANARARRSERQIISRMAEDAEKAKKKRAQRLAEDREGGYVIVYQRAGRGTLHQLGSAGCWMAKKRSFAKSETYAECPDPELYSTWCRLCWRKSGEKAPESTSDSCDQLDLSDVTDVEEVTG